LFSVIGFPHGDDTGFAAPPDMHDDHDSAGQAAKGDHAVLTVGPTPVSNGDRITGKDQVGILKREVMFLQIGVTFNLSPFELHAYNVKGLDEKVNCRRMMANG
jgi:hypothetical protein